LINQDDFSSICIETFLPDISRFGRTLEKGAFGAKIDDFVANFGANVMSSFGDLGRFFETA
jgi:hypothetical protein